MKLARFTCKKQLLWGKIDEPFIIPLKNDPFKSVKLTQDKIPFNKVKLLIPALPTKIILVGLNYKNHAKELNMKIPSEPIIFLKPLTTLIAHNQPIIYPQGVKRLDYEAELALIIKKKCKNIPENDSPEYILGYTCLNDVTARDIQAKDSQWTRAKSFDTFCPLGPFLDTELNPSNLDIKLYLNNELKQHSSTRNLIFPVNYLVSFISKIMTLFPGDIISTGTPPGVGPMNKKDVVEVEIEGIGRLKNYVA